MKRKALLILAIFISTFTYGQFNFDGGASLVISNNVKQNFSYVNGTNTIYESSEMNALGFGVFLHPRYQISEVSNFGLAIGAPSNLALEGSASSSGESSFNALLDLNVTVDLLGGGFNANADDPDAIGYYAGIGLGYTTTTNAGITSYYSGTDQAQLHSGVDVTKYDGTAEAFDEFHKTTTAGLFIHAGVGNISIGDFLQNIGVRAGIKPSFSSSRLSYYTISVFKTFGRNR